MNKDQVKGAVNDAAGRAEWTGNTGTQVEGAEQQIKGKAQKIVGNVKDAARDASKNSVDRENEQEKGREQERQREQHAHHG